MGEFVIKLLEIGIIYQTRDELDKAREYWQKSKRLFQQVGMPHRVEKVNSLLDSINNN